MHLFIDTNILLSFYHLTSDDLEELKKLVVLLSQKKVTLYVTDQVVAEFTRNREGKIADAVKKLKEQHLNLQFPQMCKDYPEYQELRELQKQYDQKHSQLLKKLHEDISAKNLRADSTIEHLFGAATELKLDGEIVAKARLRLEVGNPPGKNGSLGDAVNWELLLKAVPDGVPIYFVTEDRDYTSALDESKFKDFLLQEWSSTKAGEVVFFKRLSAFFKEKFPQIKLASELEKDLVVNQFVTSANFSSTHMLVAKLGKFTDFTGAQATAILTAPLENNQVGWIATDPDVESFLKNMIVQYKGQVDPETVEQVQALIAPEPEPGEGSNEEPAV